MQAFNFGRVLVWFASSWRGTRRAPILRCELVGHGLREQRIFVRLRHPNGKSVWSVKFEINGDYLAQQHIGKLLQPIGSVLQQFEQGGIDVGTQFESHLRPAVEEKFLQPV